MHDLDKIVGKVVGPNLIESKEGQIICYTTAVQKSEDPRPLDLSEYIGNVVEVSGHLHGELWSASFVRVVSKSD